MTTPGANIILDTNDRIGFGVYADIFRPFEGGLVYKLFIGFRHDTTVRQGLTDPEDDHRRRKDLRLRMPSLRDRRAGRIPPRPHSPLVSALRNCRRDRLRRKRSRQLSAPLLLWHGIYRRRGRQ